MNKEEILKHYYGYDSFRPAQAEIIETILSKRDVLAIMPTSAGKSICFQVPALMLDGITIVVSPLISLMYDQVTSLNEMGIQAILLCSIRCQGNLFSSRNSACFPSLIFWSCQ